MAMMSDHESIQGIITIHAIAYNVKQYTYTVGWAPHRQTIDKAIQHAIRFHGRELITAYKSYDLM
jgi:hypothetical protein